MYLISPVQSLPLPDISSKIKADVLIGDKFMSGQDVTFDEKHFTVGSHKTPSVMILSCKLIYFMRKEELPSQMSGNPDCCLFFKSIKAETPLGAENAEPGMALPTSKVLNNWMCTKEKLRCPYTMLKLGKMLHHSCHNAVKEIMHTKLASEPKSVEFYNDLNLKPENLRPPKG